MLCCALSSVVYMPQTLPPVLGYPFFSLSLSISTLRFVALTEGKLSGCGTMIGKCRSSPGKLNWRTSLRPNKMWHYGLIVAQ
ncbi:hypothetical protein F5Y08DRAFT_324346 [Xylaria arbuscula]|nr:hypothetical protein F5Y08DRAFT_324346 [Xylaria arbuscula]